MIFSQSYPHILRHELEQRVKKNPRYSLRAFAKHLGVSPGTLSNILSGRKGLSEKAAVEFSRVLNFSTEQSDFFCALVCSEHSRSPVKKLEFKKKVSEYVKTHQTFFMEASAFEAISDVRHLVLLQILKLKKVRAPLQRCLLDGQDLPLQMQIEMLDRMIQLGMLQVDDGVYRVMHETFSGPDHVSTPALKSFHLQTLELARNAIYQKSLDVRDSFFLILPFEQKRLPEVKARIRSFVDTLIDEYGVESRADSVYGLSTQFFPLSQTQEFSQKDVDYED